MIFSFQAKGIERSFQRHEEHWNSPMSDISVTRITWRREGFECKLNVVVLQGFS